MSFLVPCPIGSLLAASQTTLSRETEGGLSETSKKWSLAFGLSWSRGFLVAGATILLVFWSIVYAKGKLGFKYLSISSL